MSHDASAASAAPAAAVDGTAAVAVPAAADGATAEVESGLAGLELGDDSDSDSSALPPRRLLRAEAILSRRTARLLLVVETLQDEGNHQAILRTADSFGVQHVWIVRSGIEMKPRFKGRNMRKASAKAQALLDATGQPAAAGASADDEQLRIDSVSSVSMASGRWLTLRYFDSTSACIAALREEQRTIWVSSLSPGSAKLDAQFLARGGRIPDKLALVLGREIDGVSPEMVAAASAAVFLPMHGFSESFNVSVAAALLCQRFFDLCPEAHGDLGDEERAQLRQLWYARLGASNPTLYGEYMNKWLPRAEEIAATSRRLQEEEDAAADAAVATSAAAVASGAAAVSLIRPPEISRVPKVTARTRRKMEQSGQRAVRLPTIPGARTGSGAKEDTQAELSPSPASAEADA